jgi:hypothetical protein
VIDTVQVECLPGPLKDRINEIHEDLRLMGNNLTGLLRDVEDLLNLPEDQRIPRF